jgi:A/G-specific adenine glycosylase
VSEKLCPIANVAPRVLQWFDDNGRKHLPWQQDKTAYRVWVSEIMLQQTQVATVIPYYHAFMAAFPTVEALASATQDKVLSHWSGLGYYARARNLHKAAKFVVNDLQGEFPTTVDTMMELPGIGRSTAAAVVSIVYDTPAAILDGNVKRVLARLHAIDRWPGEKQTELALWQVAEAYAPTQRCGDYTQAMMDLGATLCTRRQPQCLLCPLQQDCRARQLGDPALFPVKKPKVNKPVKAVKLLILQHQDQVLLEKRPITGIWGGLWSLPEMDLAADIELDVPQRFYCDVVQLQVQSDFRHTFSHYHLDITPCFVSVEPSLLIADTQKYQWFALPAALALGLPAPIRQLLQPLDPLSSSSS